MTKSSKRREAKQATAQDALDEGKRQKKTRTEAAAIRPDPTRTGEGRSSRQGPAPRTRLFSRSHDEEIDADDRDRDLDQLEDRSHAGSEAGREVLESIDRWREQLARTIETMAEQPARASKQQVTALLAAQRELAENVKAGLTQFQEMIESWESQIEEMDEAAKSDKPQASMLPGLPMFAGFMPKGDIVAPMQVPMKALWSMQKAAVSSAGLWAKAAQDYQGIWMGAIHSMIPGNGAGGGAGGGK